MKKVNKLIDDEEPQMPIKPEESPAKPIKPEEPIPIDENENVFDIKDKISDDELNNLIKQQKEMEDKLKDELKKINDLKKQIEENSNIKKRKIEFNKKRTEFVFKIEFEDGIFDEKRIKGYMGGMVRGKSNGNIKIIEWKNIPNTNFIWFKTNEPIIIFDLSRKVQNEKYKTFTFKQYRVKDFFDDL